MKEYVIEVTSEVVNDYYIEAQSDSEAMEIAMDLFVNDISYDEINTLDIEIISVDDIEKTE